MDLSPPGPDPWLPVFARTALLNAFRTHYARFQTHISELDGTRTDATVIARLGDDLDEFTRMVEEANSPFSLRPLSYFIFIAFICL